MILTFGEEGARNAFEADVAIIGSGAIAMAMAGDFLGGTLKVLVLEAGPRRATDASAALYDADIAGHAFNGAQAGRARVFGGSTTLWGGQFLRLRDVVFEDRPWLGVSGWPLTKSGLEPFYRRAEAIGGLSDRTGDQELWRHAGVTPPGFDPSVLTAEFSKWSPRPHLGENLADQLGRAAEVDVLLSAAVADIRLNADGGRVEALVIRADDGTEGRVKARAYVLAAGGIESPRILLNADTQDGRGVGNRFGHVGRFFHDHVSVTAATIEPTDRGRFHELFEQVLEGGTKFAPKLVLPDDVQRSEGLLNAGGLIRFPGASGGAAAARALVRHLRRRGSPGQGALLAVQALAGLPEVAALAWDAKVRGRVRAPRSGPIDLELHVEQRPVAESRIGLSGSTDRLGMRRGVIDWRIDDASRLAARRFTGAVRDELSRLGLARVTPRDDVLDDPAAFQGAAADLYHHMGALRMSQDPSEGVVDPECRMHEVENLYAAGCAVFPASGYSNPTHTAMALALRLGDRLRTELG